LQGVKKEAALLQAMVCWTWNSLPNEPCGCRESGGLLPEQLLRTGAVVVDTWLRLVAILERRNGDGVDTADTNEA